MNRSSSELTSVTPIRVLIADDHPLVCDGLAAKLAAEPDIVVVARAHDGHRAVALCRSHRPDIALLDLRMPLLDGAEAALVISAESTTRIIMLTSYAGDEDIHRALSAGARAYLLKHAPSEHVVAAVRTVHRGGRYIPEDVSSRLLERFQTDELTSRELEVLRCIVAGQDNKSIAAQLAVTPGTVKGHISNILSKLRAADRTQAALSAIRRGLIRLE